ncbi:MAG: DUF503 domain-containing protein [Candidatus Marinimicrobia bacterium]|nr:DUF503 domain-containing protein [Candidatus Neomarinimicrobiota bacterium]
MTIGLLQMEIMLPNSKSLKDKRSVIKHIFHRVRKKYNVAISELEQNDSVGKALIGVTTLSNKADHCHQILTQVEQFVSTEFGVVLVYRNMEML